MDYNCQLWRMGINDTCTCLRHFVPEKSASCPGVDKLFSFVFISVN